MNEQQSTIDEIITKNVKEINDRISQINKLTTYKEGIELLQKYNADMEYDIALKDICATHYRHIRKIYNELIPSYFRFKLIVKFLVTSRFVESRRFIEKIESSRLIDDDISFNELCTGQEQCNALKDVYTRVMVSVITDTLDVMFSSNPQIHSLIDKIRTVLKQNDELDDVTIFNEQLNNKYLEFKTNISYVQYLFLFYNLLSFIDNTNKEFETIDRIKSSNEDKQKEIDLLLIQNDLLQKGKKVLKDRLHITTELMNATESIFVIPDSPIEVKESDRKKQKK